MDIPLAPASFGDKSSNVRYTIWFDDTTTKSVPLSEMADLIPKPPKSLATDATAEAALLPPFLQEGCKVTYDHEGQYVKGYISKLNGVYRFSHKSHPNKKKEDFGVNLPNLPQTWTELCTNGTLLPGHQASSFTRPAGSAGCFDPVANIVSAVNLARDCPASLLRALADTHPDREIWRQSYYEEKNSIESMGTFERLTLQQYRALVEKGAPKAIPSMCVLMVKKDENLLPLQAKSRIVVLGNLEDHFWSKFQRFAPVLRQDSLRFLTSLAVEKRRRLKSGDCKNAFCQSTLPPEETTIVRPPSGDPDAGRKEFWLLHKTLYGLTRSPRHWFDKIDGILKSMGLKPNAHDPCLYTGFIADPKSGECPSAKSKSKSAKSRGKGAMQDPVSQTGSSGDGRSAPLTIGLYVDDFVYFSESDEVERLFEKILADQIAVEFMGTVEWFLGIHFAWKQYPDGHLGVHMNQAGYAANLVERFDYHHQLPSPIATPYRAGFPVDAIPPSTRNEDDRTQKERKARYMSIIGSIGWLVNCTRPDLATIHKFLATYMEKPSLGHEQAAKYVLHYIHSTHDMGISFTSRGVRPMHAYVHFPHSSDLEAYKDAQPPVSERSHLLTTYSDACWGGQYGNVVKDGTPLELFKYRSMSGAIVFRCGGPIAWKVDRQDQTSLSSCEAEVRATNVASTETVGLRNLIESMIANGYKMNDLDEATEVFNDNESCVAWAHNMTSKRIRHMSLKENSVREWVQDGVVDVLHVSGKLNPADIFTKEMKDGAHFRRLRDSFMSRLSSFNSPIPQAAQTVCTNEIAAEDTPSFFSVLASNSELVNDTNVLHLSSKGKQLLWKLFAQRK